MEKVDLSRYDNNWYSPNAGKIKRTAWYYINAIIFKSYTFPSSKLKCTLLRVFGAKIGQGVVIKPGVNIKYPWLLNIGDYSWVGENAWIDNLTQINIGANVCISQGAYLLTGNHNYRDPHFGLMINPIIIEDGCWVGANVTICPGSILQKNSVITAGSVFHGSAEPSWIYKGNPAIQIRMRILCKDTPAMPPHI